MSFNPFDPSQNIGANPTVWQPVYRPLEVHYPNGASGIRVGDIG